MRRIIKDYVSVCAAFLPYREPIYEFGAFQVAGQEGFADLRPFFPGKRYLGCDMRPGPGVDLVLNLHEIDLPDEPAGVLIVRQDTLPFLCFFPVIGTDRKG